MRSKRNYTKEFKQGAVDLVVNENMSISEAGRRLGTSSKNISRWIKEYGTPINGTANKSLPSELEQRIKLLEKENTRLRKEREILKNSLPYVSAPIKIETRNRLYYDLNLESSRSPFGDFISR